MTALRVPTHYTRDGESLTHEIVSARCEAARERVGWSWLVCVTIARCERTDCPPCTRRDYMMRDRGTVERRGQALAVIADRITNMLGHSREAKALPTIRILPTARCRSSAERPLVDIIAPIDSSWLPLPQVEA